MFLLRCPLQAGSSEVLGIALWPHLAHRQGWPVRGTGRFVVHSQPVLVAAVHLWMSVAPRGDAVFIPSQKLVAMHVSAIERLEDSLVELTGEETTR